jgi:MFS family permease
VNSELQRRVNEEGLTPFQLFAIGVCVCLNMLDGFDILAMSFAASGVKTDWHLTDGQLGYLLSAGLVGMGMGSLMIAPWADRLGRRPIVLLSVAIAGLGMVSSAATSGYMQLLALRILTGIGIGGTIASVAVIVSEFAPARWRSVALAIYATGYSIGATIGGTLTALAVTRFGWRSAFAIGGLLSLVLVPIAWRRLPESLEFLLARRPPHALRRVNDLLLAMRQAAVSVLPDIPANTPTTPRVRLVTRTTLLTWFTFFCAMAGYYAILAPTISGLLLDRGWTPAHLYVLFSIPYVFAAVAMMGIGTREASAISPSAAAASSR